MLVGRCIALLRCRIGLRLKNGARTSCMQWWVHEAHSIAMQDLPVMNRNTPGLPVA